jgi:hypothetical protein
VFWVLFGVSGVGFTVVATDNTSAYLGIIAMFVLFVLSGALFILAWRRDAVTVAGQRLGWQKVNALGVLTQIAAMCILVVPAITARDPLLGAVVFGAFVIAGGFSVYIRLVVPQLDVEGRVRMVVVSFSVLVLLLGALLVVATVAV